MKEIAKKIINLLGLDSAVSFDFKQFSLLFGVNSIVEIEELKKILKKKNIFLRILSRGPRIEIVGSKEGLD